MSSCFSCENASTTVATFILETHHWLVYLNTDQAYLGRCVIVLKSHKTTLSDLSNEEWSDFKDLVKQLETAVKTSLGATMCNWACLMNNAYQTIPYNPHVHWHFRPRFTHDIKLFNVVFSDPEFGHHYSRDRKEEISEDLVVKIVNKIKQSL